MNERGSGNKLLKVTPFKDPAVVTFTCAQKTPDDQSYPGLELVDGNGVSSELIRAGGYAGRVPFSGTVVAGGSPTKSTPPFVAYSIQCPAEWTFKQGTISTARTFTPGVEMTGTGTDVIQVPVTTGGLHAINVSARCSRGETNFTINAYKPDMSLPTQILFKNTTEYTGDVVIPSGTSLLTLDGFGSTDWTIKSV